MTIGAPGSVIIRRQLCRNSQFPDACLLHVLHASIEELEELAAWSRGIHASDHVAFALGYCGRKIGIAAAAWLADESAHAERA
jgi:hypothetical protein